MKLKQKVTSWYINLREKLRKKYIILRKSTLTQWTKISEERRKQFISFFNSSFNYLQNAVLIAVPLSLLTRFSYIQSMIIIWFSLPFIEHYYVWFREKWKDDLLEKESED